MLRKVVATIWQKLSVKFLKFAQETTIHGVPRVVQPHLHPLERILWIIMTALGTVAAVTLAFESVNRYYANPTVVTLQKDYRNWFNPFPSATACFLDRADEELMDKYVLNTWGINDSNSKLDYYREFVMVVANVSIENLKYIKKFVEDPTLLNIDLMDLSAKVHPILTGNLITFDAVSQNFWKLVMTEKGICFSFNTKMAKFFTYGSDAKIEKSHSNEKMLKCHYLNGLCYARYDSDPYLPLYIYIHSYLEIVHATSETPLHVKESQELEINYNMQETTSDSSIRYLLPSQRGCRFDDEPLNSDIAAYSPSICYISCRYRLILKRCGCRPFFYPNLSGKACNLEGLSCVADLAEYLTQSPIKMGCKCPQPCDLVTYLPLVPKITTWEYGYFDQRITFRWGLLSPTTKYRREIIFGFEDLVVSIGGTVALFLGVSFISAIEVFFFIHDILMDILWPQRHRIYHRIFSFSKN